MEAFNYNTLCCHVKSAVIMICAAELLAVLFLFISKVEHPFADCQSLNVTDWASRTGTAHRYRFCSTPGSLVFWVGLHLPVDVGAIFAVMTIRYRMFLPCIAVFTVDFIISVVAFAYYFFNYFMANFDVKTQLITLAVLGVSKGYQFACSRRLFWYLQWQFDSRAVPVSALVKDGDEFQL